MVSMRPSLDGAMSRASSMPFLLQSRPAAGTQNAETAMADRAASHGEEIGRMEAHFPLRHGYKQGKAATVATGPGTMLSTSVVTRFLCAVGWSFPARPQCFF